VPFLAASLASFRITAHGNVLVTISLRPGARPTPAHASSGARVDPRHLTRPIGEMDEAGKVLTA
jgi:hypothetical protein